MPRPTNIWLGIEALSCVHTGAWFRAGAAWHTASFSPQHATTFRSSKNQREITRHVRCQICMRRA